MEVWKDIACYEGFDQVSNIGKRIDDLSNLRFGNLVAISVSGRDNFGRATWLCKCDCGNTTVCNAQNLKTGTTKSCGCLKHKPSSRRKDLTGKKFGRLTVLGHSHTTKRYAVWNCICSCGKKIQVNAPYLYNGKVKSCGCLADDIFNKEHTSTKWANDNKLIFGECVKCGSKKHLHSHHILPKNMYPEYKENYANGVTLCRECHKEFHKLYGYKCDVANLVEYLGLHPYIKDMIELLIQHRDKNGIQDLEKIKHYCDLLIQLEYGDKEIDKGYIFICTDHVVMHNGEVAYIKGKTYVSEIDGCITDEQNDDNHCWTGELDWRIFFKKIYKQEF